MCGEGAGLGRSGAAGLLDAKNLDPSCRHRQLHGRSLVVRNGRRGLLAIGLLIRAVLLRRRRLRRLRGRERLLALLQRGRRALQLRLALGEALARRRDLGLLLLDVRLLLRERGRALV